jgi:hypothetical protein
MHECKKKIDSASETRWTGPVARGTPERFFVHPPGVRGVARTSTVRSERRVGPARRARGLLPLALAARHASRWHETADDAHALRVEIATDTRIFTSSPHRKHPTTPDSPTSSSSSLPLSLSPAISSSLGATRHHKYLDPPHLDRKVGTCGGRSATGRS